MMPDLEYAPSPCPQCGAATAEEAGPICQATQGMDGDYHCAGSEREDAEGRLLYPTQESLARLEAWYLEQGRTEQAAEENSERIFKELEQHFGRTIHGWPCIPRRRARWWSRRELRTDKAIDAALAAIGRGRYTRIMGELFWEQARYGQNIYEDAGGSIWRCWCAALGLPFRPATCTYSGYFDPNAKPIHIGIDMGAGDDMTHYLEPPLGLEPKISGSTNRRSDL